jgi:hypothetical protein
MWELLCENSCVISHVQRLLCNSFVIICGYWAPLEKVAVDAVCVVDEVDIDDVCDVDEVDVDDVGDAKDVGGVM